MPELRALGELANKRFTAYLRALDDTVPRHRVEFSARITGSWALIYYRRHLVRLSPYLFLLEPGELKHASHWQELDATLRHEAAHAFAFYHFGDTGHTEAFHEALAKLGHSPNGSCDMGPENAAFRYVYACPSCDALWHRRAPLKGNWSCGACGPGKFDRAHTLVLREARDLAKTLRARRPTMRAAIREGSVMGEAVESAACAASSSLVTPPRARPASL